MPKDEDFKLLKIQTCVLKVNIHCEGCQQKVRKLLQKIEGVYMVSIDAEQQKVTVSGNVDSATLIRKLARAGKYAQLWSQKSNQNQNQKQKCIKDNKNAKNHKNDRGQAGSKAFNDHHKLTTSSDMEDDDYFDDDDGYGYDENELRLLKEKLGLINQAHAAATAGANGNKPGQANQNQNKAVKGKKGNPGTNQNQNGDGKNNNVKIGNVAQLATGMGNLNIDSKKLNELNAMNLGYHALGNNTGAYSFQHPANFQNTSAAAAAAAAANGYGIGLQHNPSMMMNMQNYQQNPSSMAMNLQNRLPYMQPQMMYQRSPLVSPYTGYYQVSPYSSLQPETSSHASHMFSDDNTSSCSIM